MKIMKYTLWATVGLSLLFASCESILDINPKDRLTTKIILRMKSNYNYTVINSIRITSRVMAIFTRIMLMC